MGAPTFFYGTLRHAPLLAQVLGRPAETLEMTSAILTDHQVLEVRDAPFPVLVPQAGGMASGICVIGLTADDIARLDFYEGGFDYDLVTVTLEDGTDAQVYMCAPDAWETGGGWDFADWADKWAEMSCHAAREVMDHFGTLTHADVAAKFGQIRARAWSNVLARQPKPPQGVFDGKIDVTRRRRAYTGYFALDEVELSHDHFDGSRSAVLERSYFIGGDAALVLPYDPVRDRVLLVEQMRMGPFGRGDPEVWHLEPIAGRIDPGETPEQAARREAREEADLDLSTLEEVSRGYASPGESTTYFHIFVGLAELPDGTARIAGLDTEGEDIRTRLVAFADFLAMAEARAVANTPLALLAYWLAHHRSRLRSRDRSDRCSGENE